MKRHLITVFYLNKHRLHQYFVLSRTILVHFLNVPFQKILFFKTLLVASFCFRTSLVRFFRKHDLFKLVTISQPSLVFFFWQTSLVKYCSSYIFSGTSLVRNNCFSKTLLVPSFCFRTSLVQFFRKHDLFKLVTISQPSLFFISLV